jgi:hypothetical protein
MENAYVEIPTSKILFQDHWILQKDDVQLLEET